MSAHRAHRHSKALWLLVPCALLGCEGPSEPARLPYDEYVPLDSYCGVIPACDETIEIAADSPALLVTDQESLAGLPLDKVLQQIIDQGGDSQMTPTELLQRMFDTMNTTAEGAFQSPPPDDYESYGDTQYHCDDSSNPALTGFSSAMCPRAEGKLARSTGFFKPGDPDHFYPVAVVNRFDLLPVSGNSCGEYRIIYAKESGKTDENNRVFMIFEGSLPNPRPGCALACRPVAEFWRSLETEKDPVKRGEVLSSFFLKGVGNFGPVVTPAGFGFGSFGGIGYYGTGGQIRVSQHMDEHWAMYEYQVNLTPNGKLRIEPRSVGNNPHPSLFRTEDGGYFASQFAFDNTSLLAGKSVLDIGMTVFPEHQSAESLQSGPVASNYAGPNINTEMYTAIDAEIASEGLGEDCPSDDPLNSDAILRRATVQSCAGCHAPSDMLGPERKLGCGLSFPDSLGAVHIDENGKISPALRDVFLPHRAEVMTTYLQACDIDAMRDNIGGPTTPPGSTKPLGFNTRRTLGGSSTH